MKDKELDSKQYLRSVEVILMDYSNLQDDIQKLEKEIRPSQTKIYALKEEADKLLKDGKEKFLEHFHMDFMALLEKYKVREVTRVPTNSINIYLNETMRFDIPYVDERVDYPYLQMVSDSWDKKNEELRK